jgi:glutamate 5-kinase
MGMPAENDTLPLIFGDSLYSIAQLSADPEVETLALKIEKPRKGLRGIVMARTEASDQSVIAEAARDRAFDTLQAKTEVLEKKAGGVYAEEPAKVALIFKASAKKTFNSSITTRNGLLEHLVKAVRKPGLPTDLKAAAKEFIEAREAWLAAHRAHEVAEDAEANAIEAVQEGKRALIAAMVEVHGLLRAKYSTNVKKAERYFRKRPKKVPASVVAQAKADRAEKAAAKAKTAAEEKAGKAARAKEKAAAPNRTRPV